MSVLGSKGEILAPSTIVRSAPESGLKSDSAGGPFRAKPECTIIVVNLRRFAGSASSARGPHRSPARRSPSMSRPRTASPSSECLSIQARLVAGCSRMRSLNAARARSRSPPSAYAATNNRCPLMNSGRSLMPFWYHSAASAYRPAAK